MRPRLTGAYIGDIIGGPYECTYDNALDERLLITAASKCTDDSFLTSVIAQTLSKVPALFLPQHENELSLAVEAGFIQMVKTCPERGFSRGFTEWANGLQPPNSAGNGSIMRLSGIPWLAPSLESALRVSEVIRVISHDNEATKTPVSELTTLLFNLKKEFVAQGYAPLGKEVLLTHLKALGLTHPYDLAAMQTFRDKHIFTRSAPATWNLVLNLIPMVTSFEQGIRLAIWAGGDTDTVASILGAILEFIYPIPKHLVNASEPLLKMIPNVTEGSFPQIVDV